MKIYSMQGFTEEEDEENVHDPDDPLEVWEQEQQQQQEQEEAETSTPLISFDEDSPAPGDLNNTGYGEKDF